MEDETTSVQNGRVVELEFAIVEKKKANVEYIH